MTHEEYILIDTKLSRIMFKNEWHIAEKAIIKAEGYQKRPDILGFNVIDSPFYMGFIGIEGVTHAMAIKRSPKS